MTTPENPQPIEINGVEFENENEFVYPFRGMTAAKAAALVSKEVG